MRLESDGFKGKESRKEEGRKEAEKEKNGE